MSLFSIIIGFVLVFGFGIASSSSSISISTTSQSSFSFEECFESGCISLLVSGALNILFSFS